MYVDEDYLINKLINQLSRKKVTLPQLLLTSFCSRGVLGRPKSSRNISFQMASFLKKTRGGHLLHFKFTSKWIFFQIIDFLYHFGRTRKYQSHWLPLGPQGVTSVSLSRFVPPSPSGAGRPLGAAVGGPSRRDDVRLLRPGACILPECWVGD